MIIGIDPGLDGAISFYNEETKEITNHILPTYSVKAKGKTKSGKEKNQRHLDVKEFKRIIEHEIKGQEQIIVMLEDVHSLHGVASNATFNFGKIVGQIQATLTCLNIEFNLVQPKIWQKEVWKEFDIVVTPERINKKGKKVKSKVDTKATSANTCRRLYPTLSILSNKNNVPHDGIVDAILIMHFAKIQKYNY